jgi:hypothetical protein
VATCVASGGAQLQGDDIKACTLHQAAARAGNCSVRLYQDAGTVSVRNMHAFGSGGCAVHALRRAFRCSVFVVARSHRLKTTTKPTTLNQPTPIDPNKPDTPKMPSTWRMPGAEHARSRCQVDNVLIRPHSCKHGWLYHAQSITACQSGARSHTNCTAHASLHTHARLHPATCTQGKGRKTGNQAYPSLL